MGTINLAKKPHINLTKKPVIKHTAGTINLVLALNSKYSKGDK